MTIYLPTSSSCQKMRFCCDDNVFAVAMNGILLVYQMDQDQISFIFSLPLPNHETPYIRINSSCYADEILIAAFTPSMLYIISVERRSIILTIQKSFTIIAWDPLMSAAFYSIRDNHILEHYILTDSGVEIDFTDNISENVTRMIVSPAAPNYCFVLTQNGHVRHYKRGYPGKPPKFMKEFYLTDSDPICELAITYFDFLVLITPHSISLYHMTTLKIATVICTHDSSARFVKVLCHPDFPDYIFGLLDTGKMHTWKFQKGSYQTTRIAFQFSSHDISYILALFLFHKKFAFLTEDMRIHILEFYRDRFHVSKLMQIPLVESRPTLCPQGLAFIHNDNINIYDHSLKLLQQVHPNEPLNNVIFTPNGKVVFSSGSSVYLIHNGIQKIFASDQFGDDIVSLKISGEMIAAQIGQKRLVVFNENRTVQELFYFDKITDFQIFQSENDSKYCVLVGCIKYTVCLTLDHQTIFAISLPVENVTTVFERNGLVYMLQKNGTLTLRDTFGKVSNTKLEKNSLAIFSKDELVLQNGPFIKLYHTENFQQILSLPIEGTLLSYMNGFVLVQNEYSIQWIPLFPSENEMIRFPLPPLPSADFLNDVHSCLEKEMHLLSISLPLPIPDDAFWLRYFMGYSQAPLPILSHVSLFQTIFMNIKGCEITEDQRSIFESCAKVWEHSCRFMSAAILFDFLGMYEDCARNLRTIRKYNLSLWYAQKRNLPESIKESVKLIAKMKESHGDFALGASILQKIGEHELSIAMLKRGIEQRGGCRRIIIQGPESDE